LGKYNIIVADPPWRYNNPKDYDSRMGGLPYQDLSIAEISSLDIDAIAARDCALFLWATSPKLPEALEVMKNWGFIYTTVAFVWVKLNPQNPGIYSGLGHWTNGNVEYVLFGKRGRPKRLFKSVKQLVFGPGDEFPSEIVSAHRGRHSKKPNEVMNRIVCLVGDLPRIELFARDKKKGWDAWGLELGEGIQK
jgi:N6-adenosine-specific RNA methylase IME4